MSIYDKYAEAVTQRHKQHGVVVMGYGFLGDGSTGTVIVDQANRLVYWYKDATTGHRGPFVAPLWDQSGIPLANIGPGDVIEVAIGYPPDNGPLSVLWQTDAGKSSTGGFTLMEQKLNAAQSPQATFISDLRVVPAPNSLEAMVQLGHYVRPSTGAPYKFEDNTGNADGGNTLTSLQTALTSGQHRIVWIFLDQENNVIKTVASTPVSALGTLPAKNEFLDSDYQAISRPNHACKWLTPVYLYYGQTSLASTDIAYEWDMRFAVVLDSDDASGDFVLDQLGNFVLDQLGNFVMGQ